MQTKQEKRNELSISEHAAAQPELLEIRREFHVPVAILFEAFASAEAVKAWWWPDGLHADRIDYDFREGESRKAQQVATDLGGLVVDKYLQLRLGEAATARDDRNGMPHPMQLRIAGPPRQMLAGPSWLTVMAIGLGTGLLVGVTIAFRPETVSAN